MFTCACTDDHFRDEHHPSARLSVHETAGLLRSVCRLDGGRIASVAAAQVSAVRVRARDHDGPGEGVERGGRQSVAAQSVRICGRGEGVHSRGTRSDLRPAGHRRSALHHVRTVRQGRARRDTGGHPHQGRFVVVAAGVWRFVVVVVILYKFDD